MSSGDIIQQKLYHAYAKVAQKLGFDGDIYHPTTLLDPISLENWTGTYKFAVAPSQSFDRAQQFNLPTLDTFIDGNKLEVGDIIVDPVKNRTYFCISKQPNLPINVVQASALISIFRPDYATVGTSYGKNEIPIMTNYPANVDVAKAQKWTNGIPAAIDAGEPGLVIHLWAPAGIIKKRDIIVDEQGNRSQVHSVNWQPLGYIIHSIEPGK